MTAPSNRLTRYVPSPYPKIGTVDVGLSVYLTLELQAIADAILLLKNAVTAVDTVGTPLIDAADDAAAALAGVQINQLYRTSGAVKVRLV